MIVGSPARAEGWSLWPNSGNKDAHKSPARSDEKSGVLSQLGTGTRNLWQKTTNALTPQPTPKKKTSYMSSNKPKQDKSSPSWFGSLFTKKEEPKPQTPSEWIGLPRPQ